MKLEGVSQKVFLDRYSLKNKAGEAIEKEPDQMWKRVASGIAKEEKPKNRKHWESEFNRVMKGFKYIPGGRVLAGAGTGYDVTYYNCYVIPNPPDSRNGILENLGHMVEIMAHGGGVGVNLSSLRPRGARVSKVNGYSSGPVNWAELYSVATHDIIQQGGSRRGALMIMLWDWHPDIQEFINVKRDLSRIRGANLSVCVSDKFMEAVKNDDDWNFIYPDILDPKYDTKWDGYMQDWIDKGGKVKVHKTIRARDLWDQICEAAWNSAEPGVVFMERYNKWHNNYYFNRINCVNPCITADTKVTTTDGIKTVGELYLSGEPIKIVVNGNKFQATNFFKTGTKQVYRLTTKEGYEIRLTKDHEIFTPHGKVEASKLQHGDKIQLSKLGAFGTQGSLEEGRVLGWLVGDGAMKVNGNATLFFYGEEKQELAPQFSNYVYKMVDGEQVVSRPYPIKPQYIASEDKAIIESTRLWRIAKRYGLSPDNKYKVPAVVFNGTKPMQQGFIQALFSADGHVAGTAEKGISVRLTSVSKQLLQDVQLLLLNFGIASKIYSNRRSAQARLLPDGRGGYKKYNCKAYHDLVISKNNLRCFAQEINFLHMYKQAKLETLLASYGKRGPYIETFTATFERLIADGREDVFDITVDKIHRFAANGMIISNCGEEGLPPWGVCNLGSLNLATFVDDSGNFDYDLLEDHVKVAVRFQDNVIDGDVYIFEGIRKAQLEGERRIGIGTMGLADALIKMKICYGSEEGLEIIEKIYKLIRDTAYDASADLAKEKGAFPKFKRNKYLNAYFIKKLPESLRNKISKYGVRNSVILMQAPTGSTSLMAGVSSGIEPVFEFSFTRRDRLGEHKIFHPIYDEWRKNHPDEDRPDYFVSAADLTPQNHVRVQAAIQKYVDASISKTVNAPKDFTVKNVKDLYTMAYEMGCKGITFMREGSRPGVLEREADHVKPEVTADNVPTITRRPLVLQGATYKMQTPVGKSFITVNTDPAGEPAEVFINIGKGGTDVSAMAEAMGRLISLVFRMNAPVSGEDRVRSVLYQLGGIGGRSSTGFGKEKVLSLPDALSKVLGAHFNVTATNGTYKIMNHIDSMTNGHIEDSLPTNLNGEEKSEDETSEDETIVTLPAQLMMQSTTHLDICPDCGDASLAHEEGCKKCYSCGYSEC